MSNNPSTAPYNSGISFSSLLLLLFIALKLTGHITWSWWWVFAPMWIPLCFVAVVLFVFFVVSFIKVWFE